MTTTTGRWPATAVFFLNGLTLSTYIVRIPTTKVAYHLTDGQLGVLGVLFAVAALASMQAVGTLVARVGSRPVLRVSLAVMPVLLALIGWVHGVAALAAVLTILGAVHGTTDAAMNSHAVAAERRAGRPILNGCHGAWSVSAVLASLITAGLAHAGVSLTVHLTGAAIALLVGGVALGPFLLPADADRRHGRPAMRGRVDWRAGWSRTVVALGLTGTALMVCEGAALGWGAVFLHDIRGASLSIAAGAVTAYTAGQTGGRLVGDRLTSRYGRQPVFRTGGLVAAAGLAIAVTGPRPATAVAGFLVAGLGSSVLLPLTFSAVGQAGGQRTATFVARFTTFTYAGILLGPGLISAAAELVGLTWALAALVPMLCLVSTLTRLPSPPPRVAATASAGTA
ncbi:MFS transporter [Micromonospora inositola]|uniref:Major Facilitator Superfamily protein n=1 Tax=Micromonospora inositola TaxID=47865 RepID=A0A1C5JAX8_9ACTN|nr:MFS transporter [Micromonospora inositola]SCG67206.1 Major Facilitator Superfamily protein [Micromonospora inositola]